MAGLTRNVKRYVRNGGDVNVVDEHGRTALHYAVMQGHAEVVDALLLAGADPSLTDPRGESAIEMARRQRRGAILAQLGAA